MDKMSIKEALKMAFRNGKDAGERRLFVNTMADNLEREISDLALKEQITEAEEKELKEFIDEEASILTV